MSMEYADPRHGRMRMLVVVINLLTILGFGLIGIIIAYVKRGDARGSLWESHFTYIIRSFWLGVLGLIIGAATAFLFIGVLIAALVGIWWLIRSIISLLRAIDGQPIRNPETLFF